MPIAWTTRRLAANMIYNPPATSWWPIVAAALAMIALGVLAASVPARRAARVQPMEALRR